jgi:hypothetical protein
VLTRSLCFVSGEGFLMVMNSPPRGLDSSAIFPVRAAIRKRHDVPVTVRNPYFRTCVHSDTVAETGRPREWTNPSFEMIVPQPPRPIA